MNRAVTGRGLEHGARDQLTDTFVDHVERLMLRSAVREHPVNAPRRGFVSGTVRAQR
jgi:hypothetical protein